MLNMDFITLANHRYSVRKFDAKPVEREKVEQILRAAQLSPTACNFQPQRILVLQSEEARAKLKKCTKYHFDAPLAFLICYDKTESWKRSFDGDDSGVVDAAIVTTHMMLAAAEIGLGTTWVGCFDPKMVCNEFKLPNNFVPVAVLPLGYPAADAKPAPGHASRLPLEKTVFFDRF